MSTLGDMAKAKAMYSNDPKDKLIGCVFDPQGFKKPDGTLDSAAMAHEMFGWAQSQFKKIEADKAAAEAEGKKDG